MAALPVALLAAPWGVDAQPAAWGQPDWGHRMEFTARADSVPAAGTLTDFPLLLSLDANQAQVFNRAKLDGSDLLVTAGDGTTVLDRQIVRYDANAMEAEIWVRAAALSQADRRFYLYYDHPGTTLVAASLGTWSPVYRAVYHFDDDPGGGVLTDSSPAGADIALVAARGWTSSDTTRAQIHQGWYFNGTTHHLSTRSISSPDSSYVISTWVLNVEAGVDFALHAQPDYWHISTQVNDTTPQPDYALSTGYVRWYPRPIPFNAGYHLFTWVFNKGTHSVQFYFDGEPRSVYIGSTYYAGRPLNPLGEPVGVLGPLYYNNEDVMKGGADEFRIREGVVSADWIRTEYRNQRDPQGFYDFGPEEVRDVTAVGPEPDPASGLFLAQNTPNPFSSRTSIRFSLEAAGTVRLAVYSVTGRRIAGLIEESLGPGTYETSWDGRTRAGLHAATGVYFLRLEMNGAARTVKIQLRR